MFSISGIIAYVSHSQVQHARLGRKVGDDNMQEDEAERKGPEAGVSSGSGGQWKGQYIWQKICIRIPEKMKRKIPAKEDGGTKEEKNASFA